jgi:hypothetical protein
MNTVTLRDLDSSMASSGNGLLSMVQMLAMSLGVAAASSVLGGYSGIFGSADPIETLHAFQATFATMGLLTLTSALIFWHLPPEARAVHRHPTGVDRGTAEAGSAAQASGGVDRAQHPLPAGAGHAGQIAGLAPDRRPGQPGEGRSLHLLRRQAAFGGGAHAMPGQQGLQARIRWC